MKVPLLDLKLQFATIRDEVEHRVKDVLESQLFILGPVVSECESAIAEYCDCEHAIGLSSGSDALLISLMAEGIGAGDEVITTPYTFFATGGCIARLGAIPVFVDICPETYNIDVTQIEAKITDRTKAIIPVHLYGQCVDMDVLMAIACHHGLIVIEDAAQAIGAEFQGKRAGSMGHYGCFSFFPSKNLGCGGDGGMVTTNDPERAERLRSLRNHGSSKKYYYDFIGGNFRFDAIQAAIINVKLPHLDDWTKRRNVNAGLYVKLFESAGLQNHIVPPKLADNRRHVFNQFVIRADRRDELHEYLGKMGIGTDIYYPLPLHLQNCFEGLKHSVGDFPHSEQAAAQTLALPVFPELTVEQIKYVVDSIAGFYGVAYTSARVEIDETPQSEECTLQPVNVRIHVTADVSDNAEIGQNSSIWHQAQIREGARLGENCIVGKGVYIDFGVTVGSNSKIQNGSALYHGCHLEDGVFIGPGVIIANDRFPRAINPDGSQKGINDWEVGKVLIRRGASIGTRAVILPNVTIGEFAMVGAGAVVTKDVPAYGLVFGSPAVLKGYVCRCGHPLKEGDQLSDGIEGWCEHCEQEQLIAVTQWA